MSLLGPRASAAEFHICIFGCVSSILYCVRASAYPQAEILDQLLQHITLQKSKHQPYHITEIQSPTFERTGALYSGFLDAPLLSALCSSFFIKY